MIDTNEQPYASTSGAATDAQSPNAAATLVTPGQETATTTAANTPGIACVELTKENFDQVVASSRQYPVVLNLTKTGEAICDELTATLKQITREYEGRFQLAVADIVNEPEIGQALSVNAVPTVIALLAGQGIPLFSGKQPADQIRAVIDQLLQMAAQAGINGRAELVADPDAESGPQVNPEHAAALAAQAAGDLQLEIAEWEKVLRENPRDYEATKALARAKVMQRADNEDANTPEELADKFIANGNSEAAFKILLDAIGAAHGDRREELRKAMIEALNASDDAAAVSAARRQLATLLMV